MSPRKVIFTTIALLLLVVLIIDQYLLIKTYNPSAHFLFTKNIDPILRGDPKHGFLTRPDAGKSIELLMIKQIEGEHHSDYILDQNGMRQSEELKKIKRDLTINVFGDSFTFGIFLKENETYIHHLNNESSRCKFVNYAVPAFSLLKMINLSFDSTIVAKGDHNLFVFITDDLDRIFRTRGLHDFDSKIDLAFLKREIFPSAEFIAINFPKFLIDYSFIVRVIYEKLVAGARRQVTLDMILRGLQGYLGKYTDQTSYSFIHLPDKQLYLLAPDIPKSLLDLSIVPDAKKTPTPEFQSYFFPFDGHPNAKGARWIADQIKKQLQAMCFSKK